MERQLIAGGTGGKLYLKCEMSAFLHGFPVLRRFKLHLGRGFLNIETI